MTVMPDTERNRSYRNRVKRGDHVVTLRDLRASWSNGDFTEWKHVDVPAGTELVVVSETNAGFRGIEFHANVVVDGVVYHVMQSTGCVRKVES